MNEITDVTENTGAAWVTPAYDRGGNMTTIPKPSDPTASFAGTYDAWNRLVRLVDNATSETIQEDEYDGRRFRVVRQDYSAGLLAEARHAFYTSRWQANEERLGTSTAPERQFVWGVGYSATSYVFGVLVHRGLVMPALFLVAVLAAIFMYGPPF